MNTSFCSYSIPSYSFHTVVVGTGAAGYNAADTLTALGVTDLAIVTEGRFMGTSRNTGSDKQTYYKLTLSGDAPDSVGEMAKTLFEGGSMHGDIALAQAAGSASAFFKLVGLGVPFPRNEFGEYVGYKTDHDPRMRATSCGPLTSKYMTEALEKSVLSRNVPFFDGHRVIKILTEKDRAVGLLCLSPSAVKEDNPLGIVLFAASNVIWATGGPSAIYSSTVYPESQTCAHGAAFEAGAAGVNLTESQYGIASLTFRWNLSGTYQQVIPRYLSTDENGEDEREFLDGYFASPEAMLGAIFLKGYEWPFDPRKLGASSTVDMAIYRERQAGRRVWLDFTRNPSVADRDGAFDFSLLPEVALSYLKKSGALLPTPIERLSEMNGRAIALYASHGIDLAKDRLEIDVCAQHNNGGLDTDVWSESTTLSHFYPVGECAGTFGVYRPGGSALNATQVGSMRAAEHIAQTRDDVHTPDFPALLASASEITALLAAITKKAQVTLSREEILARRLSYGKKMTECGAFVRSLSKQKAALSEVSKELASFEVRYAGTPVDALTDVMINRDILLTEKVYLEAMIAYAKDGGRSRGSYLITESPDAVFTAPKPDKAHASRVGTVRMETDGTVHCSFEPVRPIPGRELWFETVYNRNSSGKKT